MQQVRRREREIGREIATGDRACPHNQRKMKRLLREREHEWDHVTAACFLFRKFKGCPQNVLLCAEVTASDRVREFNGFYAPTLAQCQLSPRQLLSHTRRPAVM